MAFALATTGKQVFATAATAVTAGVTAAQLGVDPLPWVIGAAGGTVVYAYRTAATRAHALANGLISVFLGGVGSPYAATILGHYFDPVLANQYALAGVMSAAWPWMAPALWSRAMAFLGILINNQKIN